MDLEASRKRGRLECTVPPWLLTLVTAGLMGAVGWLVPGLSPEPTIRIALSLLPSLTGAALLLTGMKNLYQAETSLSARHPERASGLVSSGAFNFSRHPMYTGQAGLLLGWALYLADPVAWVFVPLWCLWIHFLQIEPEEEALWKRFGVSYESYSHRVGKWL